MTIGLIAHDAKKELMAQFCIAYSGILCSHKLIATSSTAKTVQEATKLSMNRILLGGGIGGFDQMVASISCGETDMLFYFRDPLALRRFESQDNNILRVCDSNDVPIATNIATGEAMIHALERGDLDWLNMRPRAVM
jgi:methylglyoxal synthase